VIVVDTNVLVALADRRDAHHVRSRDWLARCDDRLIVLPTVLAETCYMIDRFLGPAAEPRSSTVSDLDLATPDAGTALSAHLALEKGSLAPEWSPDGPQLRLIEGDKA
jgi:predicted nucleic acid-binding protein